MLGAEEETAIEVGGNPESSVPEVKRRGMSGKRERDQARRSESEECPWTCVVGSPRKTCPELLAQELVGSRESRRGRIVKREYGPSRTFVMTGWSESEVETAGEGCGGEGALYHSSYGNGTEIKGKRQGRISRAIP